MPPPVKNVRAASAGSSAATDAANAGYDAVIIANHHVGSGAGADPDAAFCGSGDPRSHFGVGRRQDQAKDSDQQRDRHVDQARPV